MDARVNPITPPMVLSEADDSEPKVLAKAKATIKYSDIEITLESYCASDIATIAKNLGE